MALSPLTRFLRFYVVKARLPRRRRGLRARRDRRVRELPQVHEAARPRGTPSAAKATLRHDHERSDARSRHRRGRVHRHARRAQAARRGCCRSSASTASIPTTTSRSRRRGPPRLRPVRATRSSASTSPRRTPPRGCSPPAEFDHVVHLAAQPGVRYSLIDPGAYHRNNLVAFGHVLEGCRQTRGRASRARVRPLGVRRAPRRCRGARTSRSTTR